MTRTLSRARLVEAGACDGQVELFAEIFGDGVEVTVELCRVHAQSFDWAWAAEHLLGPSARKVYDEAAVAALEVYHEATAAAWKVYDEAVMAAWKAYYEAKAVAREACDEARAAAWKAYEEAVAPARKAYHEARAAAWARAYLEDAS